MSYCSTRLAEARDHYYPGWWTYTQSRLQFDDLKPLYRVFYRDEQEKELAREAKPSCVRAEFVKRQAEPGGAPKRPEDNATLSIADAMS